MIFQDLSQISQSLQPVQKRCSLPGKLDPKYEAF